MEKAKGTGRNRTVLGVNLDTIAPHPPSALGEIPMKPMVPGRVCHIDGDFMAYMVAYDDSKSILDMQHNCDVMAEKMRLMSGAEKVVVHLTPKGSNKGGRFGIALLKEYQGNRKDKPKPKYLHMIRDYMHTAMGAIMCVDCEADDSMSAHQYRAIAKGEQNLSVIATKDKDLTSVPGLQVNWDTGELTDTKDDPFGWITLDRSKSSPKIKGRGWKFFWAQLLVGDAADNISGLPGLGAVKAFDALEEVKNNAEAFALIKSLYKAYGENKKKGFKNYRNKKKITWDEAMRSEMQMLWMRRTETQPRDVFLWLKEVLK